MSAVRAFAAVIALFTLGGTAVMAQDYGPYGYGAGGAAYGFDWNGYYAGFYGGGVPMGTTSWNAGIFTGVNVQMDSIVFGAEAQLGADFSGTTSLDALIMGKGGLSLGNTLVYGTLGTGFVQGDFGYALGGGAEYGLTQTMTVRGEALATGKWGAGPRDLRLAAGLAFHL